MSWQALVQGLLLIVALVVTVPLLGRYIANVFGARREVRQRQVQGGGEHLIPRGVDAEVVAEEGVRHLVVLPPADAVNEQVAQAEAGEQGEGERPRAE